MGQFNEFNKVLEKAKALGEAKHPQAPAHHHAAFANSVATCVTGCSGGYGGPSMREHLAARSATGGLLTFDEAVKVVEACCYGPLTLNHARMLVDEHCFDDAPGEVEEAQRLLAEHYAKK